MSKRPPIIVVVGGGFDGLSAAKALRRAPERLLLIDRTNHHLFQPLLYHVATSVLSPAQMASPIREIVRKHQNTTVLMAEVVDYLILGGATHSYFGHTDFEQAFLGKLHGRDDLVSGRVRWTDLTPTEWRERDERALTRQWQPGLFSLTRRSFSERLQPLASAGWSRAVSRYERRRRFRA
jgi:NADH:quinone reductase (non-electrogenic)